MQAKEIVADENIHFAIIKKLEEKNFSVFSILKEKSGILDEEVIQITQEKSAILITEDSDFGEWVFAHHIDTISVIFLRYHFTEVEIVTQKLIALLCDNKVKFDNHFFVLTPKKIRIRKII